MSIRDLGFDEYAKKIALDQQVEPIARVIEEHRTRWILQGDEGQLDASVRGALHYDLDTEAFPKVGDWVTYTLASEGNATIETILPRASMITRKNIHGEGRQVIVTNVDTVAVVQSFDQDFSTKKLERYLELVRESGARPIIIFTKNDLKGDVEDFTSTVAGIAPDVPLIAVSALTEHGLDDLMNHLKPRETVVLLGASGAGKSTLLNALMKEDIQETRAIRADDGKGRHTTTKRSLFILPNGALLIDTPGMREVSIASDEEEKKDTFPDVIEISYGCKFPNCDHEKSKGCAVLAALEEGTLSEERYKAFLKFLSIQKKAETTYDDTPKRADRIKSNRATLNYLSRRQSEEE